ncbi:MAG: FYDLN acid domain-containing protein [Proteobacteria bacterium]|nr:FYDLN acid domain-containing protein [Pseudomonadota bacterium]
MLENQVATRSALQTKRGTKLICKNESCGSRYYDLRSPQPACPYCGEISKASSITRVDFETLAKQPPGRFKRPVEPTKPQPKVAINDVDETELVDESAEKESELPSASEDLLIEIEDEDDDAVEAPEASTDDMT